MKAWKKGAVIFQVVIFGSVLLIYLLISPSIMADETGQDMEFSSAPSHTLSPEILERRVEFDERWELLKNDPEFMKILEREKEREFFHLEVAPLCNVHNISYNICIECLTRNISIDLCESAAEKITVCAETKPLAECETAAFDIVGNIVELRAEIERVREEREQMSLEEKRKLEEERVFYHFEETPIDPEYKEILDRIEGEYGQLATRKLFLEMGDKVKRGESVDAIQYALNFEEKLKNVVKQTSVTNFYFEYNDSSPTFKLIGVKGGKLLGLKAVTVNIEVVINSATFKIESIKKPWWSFLVW